MFGKLEATASINTTGVGLGLSICKKIIEALDGYIYLKGNVKENKNNPDYEDRGTTFVFALRLEESYFPSMERLKIATISAS